MFLEGLRMDQVGKVFVGLFGFNFILLGWDQELCLWGLGRIWIYIYINFEHPNPNKLNPLNSTKKTKVQITTKN